MTDKAVGKAHHRSPRYPSIDLGYAVEMAQKFFDHAKRTVAPSQNVATYWGFSDSSSGWRLALAALKQYGLLESVGGKKSGEVKLTDLALKILLDTRQSSTERDEAIKQAALNPEIYKEVWLHWGGNVPDEATFRTYLTLHKDFNENSVLGFITDFKKTISFAKLTPTDKMPAADGAAGGDEENEEEEANTEVQPRQQRRRPMQPGTKEDVFTLDEGAVVVQYPERLSKASFEDFEDYLQLVIRKVKRSIVQDEVDDAGE
jgi:hypothetical protein